MTEIKIMNTNYNVSKENESFKINGTCIYSDRVDSLSLEVYTLEGYYVGNVFYQELGDENNNVNYTVNKESSLSLTRLSAKGSAIRSAFLPNVFTK